MSALIRLTSSRSSNIKKNESAHIKPSRFNNYFPPNLFTASTATTVAPTISYSCLLQTSPFSSSVPSKSSAPSLHFQRKLSKQRENNNIDTSFLTDEPMINYYNRWLLAEDSNKPTNTSENINKDKDNTKEKKEDSVGKSVKEIQESIYEECKC